MVSKNDEYWNNLKKEVEDYNDGKLNIENFAEKKDKDDWLYQQKIAESRRNYYPVRIGQVGFVAALLSSIIALIFKDVTITLTGLQITLLLIIIVLSIAFCFSKFYLIKRFSNMQDLIEKIERTRLELNKNKIESNPKVV